MKNQAIIKRAIVGAAAAAILTVAATAGNVFAADAKEAAKKQNHNAAHYTKVGLEDTGKATDRAFKDTGKAVGVAFKDTGKATGDAAAVTGRETGRVFKRIGHVIF